MFKGTQINNVVETINFTRQTNYRLVFFFNSVVSNNNPSLVAYVLMYLIY